MIDRLLLASALLLAAALWFIEETPREEQEAGEGYLTELPKPPANPDRSGGPDKVKVLNKNFGILISKEPLNIVRKPERLPTSVQDAIARGELRLGTDKDLRRWVELGINSGPKSGYGRPIMPAADIVIKKSFVIPRETEIPKELTSEEQ